MRAEKLPMNLDLLIINDDISKRLPSIDILDIFESNTRNFHAKGLFSNEIFGRVGDPKRETSFAYIPLNIEVYHPFVYKTIVKLKSLYGEIMSGKAYAIFDNETKDFIKSDPIEGETGFNFFMSNFDKVDLARNTSIKRDYHIELIEKYRGKYTMSRLIVLPAGLRDIELDKNNRQVENDINKLYRRVIGHANLIKDINIELNKEYVNNIRYNIQLTILEIYMYIKEMLEGKRGMIQDKWASRKIFNSTRNVITAYIPTITTANDPRTVSANHTVVGLYQLLKAIFPLSTKLVKDEYLNDVFPGNNSPIFLVDKKTFKKKMVNFSSKIYDEWMTVEGLEKKINIFGREDTRHDYIEINGYYLLLVYKGTDGTFKVIQDKDDVPEHLSSYGTIEPITYTELFMLSVYKHIEDIPAFITRYPAIEYGSIYPSMIYLKSTIKAEIRMELNSNWEPSKNICNEFPLRDEKFFEAVAPSFSHLKRLGADFDGDTVSFTCVITEEAKEEVKKKLSSKEYYVDVNNSMYFGGETDVSTLVLGTLTQ